MGTYEIRGPLGAGGMGEVYRAHDIKLGRDVALKILPAALANDSDYMARFRSEAPKVAHESVADQDTGLEHSAGGDNWNRVVPPAGPFQKRGRQISEVAGRLGAQMR